MLVLIDDFGDFEGLEQLGVLFDLVKVARLVRRVELVHDVLVLFERCLQRPRVVRVELQHDSFFLDDRLMGGQEQLDHLDHDLGRSFRLGQLGRLLDEDVFLNDRLVLDEEFEVAFVHHRRFFFRFDGRFKLAHLQRDRRAFERERVLLDYHRLLRARRAYRPRLLLDEVAEEQFDGLFLF